MSQDTKPLFKSKIPERDLVKYPNPQDEPESERRLRLGLREREEGEDIISWGQNAFQPISSEKSNAVSLEEAGAWIKSPEFAAGLRARIEAQNALLTTEALKRDGLI